MLFRFEIENETQRIRGRSCDRTSALLWLPVRIPDCHEFPIHVRQKHHRNMGLVKRVLLGRSRNSQHPPRLANYGQYLHRPLLPVAAIFRTL